MKGRLSKEIRRRPGGRRASATFTLADVARAVGGRIAGDPSVRLSGVKSLSDAGPSELTFLADDRRVGEARSSRAGAFLLRSEETLPGRPAVIVESPLIALATWLEAFVAPERPRAGIARGARIHRTARLGSGVSVAAGATVERGARVGARTVIGTGAYVGVGVELGADCTLHPNAVVLARCRVGARCVLHSGAVIGSDGFGYVWDGARHRKVPQVGIVRLEDDVEVGSNAAIDRATLGETVVGRGTKIDNLVQIAHNVIIGEHSLVCGQAGVAGSSRIGNRVTLAGQAGIADHVTIGDGAIATAQSGIGTGSTVEAGAVVSGMPALPHREFLRRAAWLARLPELARRLEELERKAGRAGKGGSAWSSESRKS